MEAQHVSVSFVVLLGLAGNVIFGSRFLLQWVASERAGKSVIPKVFWHISIVGSLVCLAYALLLSRKAGWIDGLPMILGYALNSIVYVRNLMLIDKHEKAFAAPAGPVPVPAECASEEIIANG